MFEIAWQSDVVIDENSTADLQSQLARHLRRQNSELPVNRLGAVKFSASSKRRLIQLADLVAGAVRRSVTGDAAPMKGNRAPDDRSPVLAAQVVAVVGPVSTMRARRRLFFGKSFPILATPPILDVSDASDSMLSAGANVASAVAGGQS